MNQENKNVGWCLLYRSILQHPIVGFKKPFSKAEAWIWMILQAKYEVTKEMRKVNKSETLIETPRGVFTHSIRFLAQTWGWSKSKVERFLKWVEDDHMIERKSGQKVGQIIICNYDNYQTKRDSRDDNRGTTKGQLRDNNKEIKEKKEIDTPNSNEMKLTLFTIEMIKKNHPHIDFNKNEKQKICKMFNLLISKDGFTYEEIQSVIEWVTGQTERSDKGFCWADQFQSPLKLKIKNKEKVKYIDVWISAMQKNGSFKSKQAESKTKCPNCNSPNTSWSSKDKHGNVEKYKCVDYTHEFL